MLQKAIAPERSMFHKGFFPMDNLHYIGWFCLLPVITCIHVDIHVPLFVMLSVLRVENNFVIELVQEEENIPE